MEHLVQTEEVLKVGDVVFWIISRGLISECDLAGQLGLHVLLVGLVVFVEGAGGHGLVYQGDEHLILGIELLRGGFCGFRFCFRICISSCNFRFWNRFCFCFG